MIYFPLIFLEEKFGINVTFFGLKNIYTPGDHIFFLGKNLYGNTSCVSNVFFLKKNEKFISRKNIIKMKHFIHTGCRKDYFFQKNLKNIMMAF
jgi:hypothetical protein